MSVLNHITLRNNPEDGKNLTKKRTYMISDVMSICDINKIVQSMTYSKAFVMWKGLSKASNI